MPLRKYKIFRWYYPLFNFIAKERLKKGDTDVREIHAHLIVVLTTGILMWAYSILAFYTISSPWPGIVGFVCSFVHTLSPLIYRFTNSSYVAANVLITAGMIHQGTFSFFTGGFSSHIVTWFGILPMLGGMISGRKGAITWLVCTVSASLTFLLMEIYGYKFPHLISPLGLKLSQAFLVFGWIFLTSCIVTAYIEIRSYSEKLLKEQGRKIDDLFRVLFHDLANPLGRISIGLSMAKRQLPDNAKNRGLEIADSATETMMAITQNIRKMYAVSKGRANVDLSLNSFNTSMEYVMKVYASEIEKKQIKIIYHHDKYEGLNLLVEPVSFNNQVLGNILNNAIKFSPPESQIFVTVYPRTPGTYTVEVKDNGIGIPQELLNHLFDINKKTSRPGTNGEQGSGFGMHIMKSFVDMYGGVIQVESHESHPSGTTVKITLKGEWET